MTQSGRKTVTIFGSSKPKPGQPAYQDAYQLGLALADAGFDVCTGAYAGTMQAAAHGAKDAGGTTSGVTCKMFARSGPNPYIDHVLEAPDLFRRLEILINQAHAFVVLPGGSGTLVELAMVWELIAKRLIQPRPIILYRQFWNPVIEAAATERPKSKNVIQFADSPRQVVELLKSYSSLKSSGS